MLVQHPLIHCSGLCTVYSWMFYYYSENFSIYIMKDLYLADFRLFTFWAFFILQQVVFFSDFLIFCFWRSSEVYFYLYKEQSHQQGLKKVLPTQHLWESTFYSLRHSKDDCWAREKKLVAQPKNTRGRPNTTRDPNAQPQLRCFFYWLFLKKILSWFYTFESHLFARLIKWRETSALIGSNTSSLAPINF